MPLKSALARFATAAPFALLAASVQAAMPVESRRAIELVGPVFWFAADGASFLSEDPDLSADLRDALRLTATPPNVGGTVRLFWEEAGRTRLFLLAPVATADRTEPEMGPES
jgi:hypothetical protein